MRCPFAVVAIFFLLSSPGAPGWSTALAGESLPGERGRTGSARGDRVRLARAGNKTERTSVPVSVSARSASVKTTAGTGSLSSRTDSELMLDALKASGVESPNARRIERVVEENRAESKRKNVGPAAVWKDPFAEDPERLIPVRPAAGTSLKGRGAALFRRDQARARAEVAAAEAAAATSRAAAARNKANLALSMAAEARAAALAARVRASVAKRDVQIAEAAVIDPALARRLALARAQQRARARGQAIDAAFTESTRKRPAAEGPRGATAPQSPPEALVPSPPYEALAKGPATGILVVPITR
jgi:hypothetical protein